MDTANKIERKIQINANASTVWNALTTPEQTKKYMFNCAVKSDWKVGSTISWHGNYQGYESGEKGIILIFDCEKQLKYSSFDPNFGLEETPENYLHVTYLIESIGDKTNLTVQVENFNSDEMRLQHVAKGWDTIVLPALIQTFAQIA